jgi:hypothetical protein
MSWLVSYGFIQSLVDPGFFVVFIEKLIYILVVYVDESILAGKAGKFFTDFKTSFSERFEIEDLGPASWLLGCRIYRDREKRILRLSQDQYVSEITEEFGMGSSTLEGKPIAAKVVSKLRSDKLLNTKMFSFPTLIGKLLYRPECTRPEITADVNHLNRYISKCTMHHMDQAKRPLRYVSGTRPLCFTLNENISSEGIMWQDSSFGNGENRRSRTRLLGMMCG